MEVTSAVVESARQMLADCDLDSIDIFLCDKAFGATRLTQLFHQGIPVDVLDRYAADGICDLDPFTDPDRHEHEDAVSGGFHLARDLQRSGRTPPIYWRFTAEHRLETVGASTRRLLSRRYLVIGVHRHTGPRARTTVATAELGARLAQLQSIIMAEMLTFTLRTGKQAAFNRLMSGRDDHACLEEVSSLPLSKRETEIAKLICLGKQNKEVAYAIGLSEYTIENHLRRIYRKLNIRNRSSLVGRVGPLLA